MRNELFWALGCSYWFILESRRGCIFGFI